LGVQESPGAKDSCTKNGQRSVQNPVHKLAAHQEVAVPSRVDPAIAEAVERQNRAMRELSRRAFPEPPAVPDDAPAPIEQARVQRRRQAAVTEAAALRRARAEKAGALPRETAPSLGRTA
jgi:hypothetical protein